MRKRAGREVPGVKNAGPAAGVDLGATVIAFETAIIWGIGIRPD